MQEKILKAKSGVAALFINIFLMVAAWAVFVFGINYSNYRETVAIGVAMIVVGALYGFLIAPVLFCGIKSLKANEALVLTLFGKYHGTLKGEGMYFVNPFCESFNPAKTSNITATAINAQQSMQGSQARNERAKATDAVSGKKISLKVLTLNNEKQKVNDSLGNPVEIGVVVIWKVVNTVKAVYEVDNYMEFLSIQADSALRNIVRTYPYDISDDADNAASELSLRGSSLDVAQKLQEELQSKVLIAGLEIVEAKITHLAYAPEIAAVMLQRQQASAIIDARKLIVEGAVGMVKMALSQLSDEKIVELDDERKAAMVSNLLVVLCGNKDAQPIVNSGSIY